MQTVWVYKWTVDEQMLKQELGKRKAWVDNLVVRSLLGKHEEWH